MTNHPPRNRTTERRLRDNVHRLLAAYSDHAGVARASVPRLIFGDANYLRGIFGCRKSSSFRVRTYDIVIAAFSDQWPAGAPWPIGIDRLMPADVPDMPTFPIPKKKD